MNIIQQCYCKHSPITDPGEYAHLYDDLPDAPRALIQIIQGQMLHRNAAQSFSVTLTRESRAEQRLRTMKQRLARIAELGPAPLTVSREPREKQVGMCRDFAVFFTSLLRHKGIPARMRVGFADYLFKDNEFKADHWITEYWDAAQGRWILADPDVGGLHFADIQRLLDVLHRLVDAGNTVVVIEHNLDVIRTADWIIDLGPEGGDKGGHIVAEGTPEQVAKMEMSYTGKFLRGSVGQQ